jgi:hypothetical protein
MDHTIDILEEWIQIFRPRNIPSSADLAVLWSSAGDAGPNQLLK